MLFDADSGLDSETLDIGDCKTCVWTPGVAGSMYISMMPLPANNRKWTFSCWIRRATLGVATSIFGAGATTANVLQGNIGFDTTNHLIFSTNTGYWSFITTRVFIDTSAWMYLQVNYDSAQAVAADRVKFYVNGVREFDFTTATYPTINRASTIGAVDKAHQIGFSGNTYIANVCFIDGESLDPSSFGAKSPEYNEWRALSQESTATLCSSYGTSSFFLTFATASTQTELGYDASTHNNDFVVANHVLTGRSPNWMAYGPAKPHLTFSTLGAGAAGLSNGNLTYTGASEASREVVLEVPFPYEIHSSYIHGVKYFNVYIEAYVVSNTGAYIGLESYNPRGYPGSSADSYGWNLQNGNIYKNGVAYQSLGYTAVAGDTIMFALVLQPDNASSTMHPEFYIGKNGSWRGGDEPGNSSGAISTYYMTCNHANLYFAVGSTSTAQLDFNFGQRPFSYALPDGCAGVPLSFTSYNAVPKLLPRIKNPSDHFDVLLGAGSEIKALADARYGGNCIEWIKSRSGTDNWQVMDTARGLTLSAPFTQNTVESGYATPPGTAVAYVFNTGTPATSNSVGTQTSVVSVNTEAGISAVTYSSVSGSSFTFGTGLVDEYCIRDKTIGLGRLRNFTSAVYNWVTGYGCYGDLLCYASTGLRELHPGTTEATSTPGVNSIKPVNADTVSLLSVSTSLSEVNYLNYPGVVHFFTMQTGFLTVVEYKGNGLADGPLVYLGFRPKMLLIRVGRGTVGSWYIVDSARSPYNTVDDNLQTNTSVAETASSSTVGFLVSFLSNGFKVQSSASTVNTNGAFYVVFAVADVASPYALAR